MTKSTSLRLWKQVTLVCLISIITLTALILNSCNTVPNVKKVAITITHHQSKKFSVNIALLSDLHIRNNFSSIAHLMDKVRAEKPDIIMLAGDYIYDGTETVSTEQREIIAKLLSPKNKIPVFSVMGNHEHWSNLPLWTAIFETEGIRVLNNQVEVLDDLNICIRGLGDYFTNQFRFKDFPDNCNDRIRITLTHDPAGAFDDRVKGLVLAGHTHCGQVVLPFVGALIMPTEAPKGARCGLYEDEDRQVYVSSGVGTSVLPIRFQTKSEWDFITLSARKRL